MGDLLKLGILGTASIADRIVAGAGRLDCKGVGRRRPDPPGHRPGRRPAEFPHADSYDALLESGAVDAVYILPTGMHAEWTVRALSAGLPVLCEKRPQRPRTMPRGSGMPRFGQTSGRRAFMCAPLYRQVEQNDRQWQNRNRQIDRAGSAGSATTRPRGRPVELHGGALFDVGCYCVHLSRKIAGREPVSVMAAAETTSSTRAARHGLRAAEHGR